MEEKVLIKQNIVSPQQSKKKRKTKKKRRNFTLLYILLALFLAGGGIYLCLTMFFNVEEIIVTGNTRYTEEELIETTGIKLGDNLFRIDAVRAEDKLLSIYSYVDEVTVEKRFPTRVYVNITEAVPFASLEESDGFTLISSRGKVLERAMEISPPGMVEVRGISTVLSDEEDEHRLKLLGEMTGYMEELNMSEINFIDLSDTLDIVLIIQNRLRVELGNELELQYKLQFVNEVINEKIKEHGFILLDASTPGKVMRKELTVSPWNTIVSQSPQMMPDDEEE